MKLTFRNEETMLSWANKFSQSLKGGEVIHLQGDLGMGKTTLSRGIIRGLGHRGNVKSPTYTIVEPYEHLSPINVYHFDLYRLSDPEELEFMGIRDYFHDQSVCLIEWPEKGYGVLPDADLRITLLPWNDGRCLELAALTEAGLKLAEDLQGIS